MFTVNEIIATLDNYRDYGYGQFISLRPGENFLIDSRLNLFRHPDGRWAVVFEKLLFDVAEQELLLELYYFGNCITCFTAQHDVVLMDEDAFCRSGSGWWLKKDAPYWKVRGKKLPISHNRADYIDAGIKPENTRAFSLVEAMRQLAFTTPEIFRATNRELYRCVPSDMEKVLVLDEWYHADYVIDRVLELDNMEVMLLAREFRNLLDTTGYSIESRKSLLNAMINDMARQHCAPGVYETWPMLAMVLVTGDPGHYQPKQTPTSHWSYWPNRCEAFKRPGYA